MSVQSSSKTSITQRFDSYQPSKTLLVWACVVTAIATMIIGFSWGGWVTGGTSSKAAATAGDVARGELASAICVERFNASPDAAAKLTEAGGWATMPGQKSADSRSVEGCATALAV